MKLFLLLLPILLLLSGCVYRPHTVLGCTSSVIGIDIAQSESGIPHVRIGFVRTQYHVVPTSDKPIFAPSVQNSINVGGSTHAEIDEDFAVGAATKNLDRELQPQPQPQSKQ